MSQVFKITLFPPNLKTISPFLSLCMTLIILYMINMGIFKHLQVTSSIQVVHHYLGGSGILRISYPEIIIIYIFTLSKNTLTHT